MPIVLNKHNSNGSTYDITETGLMMYKGFTGQKNIDLGGGNFAPYVWDGSAIRYGDLSCEFYPDGYQVVREFGSVETLIDDQRFELQYWRTQGGGSWRILDLWRVGLTVNQQEDYCIVTRNLSDGEGNTLDIDFLFRPHEKVKNTFRLHVVDTTLTYRIRFQNSGIAGTVTEVPFIKIGTQNNLGIYKLLFENIKFEWNRDEIDIHSYTIEDQAGGKKLDIFIGDFVLDANGDVVISPDTWGPTTTSNDCMEVEDSTYHDDQSGDIACGHYNALGGQIDAGWKFENVEVPADAILENGCKIACDTQGSGNSLGDGAIAVLEIEDSRSPANYSSGARPSQRSYHGTTIQWNQDTFSGSFDSPEIKTVCQDRIDDDHVSGDDWAFRWNSSQSSGNNVQAVEADTSTLTIVYTEAGGVEYQRAVSGALASIGDISRAVTAKRTIEGAI